MKKKIVKMSLLSCCLSSIVFLAGCNTISGAGQDIQSGGHAISSSAQKVKSNI